MPRGHHFSRYRQFRRRPAFGAKPIFLVHTFRRLHHTSPSFQCSVHGRTPCSAAPASCPHLLHGPWSTRAAKPNARPLRPLPNLPQHTMPDIHPSLAPFTTKDAILHPHIPARVTEYVDSGGALPDVCHELSSSYTGDPDVIHTLISWAHLTGAHHGQRIVNHALENVLRQHQPSIIPSVEEHLATHPTAVATVEALASAPQWAPVMADIARHHKQSAFYDIVTREARLSEIGLSSHILHSPHAFINELSQQVRTVLTCPDHPSTPQLPRFLRRIAVMSTYDECTTIVALRFFAEMSRYAKHQHVRALYRRVSQEIRKEAVQVMTNSSIVPTTTARQYISRLAINMDAIIANVSFPKPVLDALVSIADGGQRRRFDKEIAVLMAEYTHLLHHDTHINRDSHVSSEKRNTRSKAQLKVFIQALCHPEVFFDLLKALYSHSCRTYVDGRPDPKKRRCVSLLFSYAAVFSCIDDRDIEEKLNDEKSSKLLGRAANALYQRLHDTAQICEDLTPGSSRGKIKGKAVETLLAGTKDAWVARGIMIWAKECLGGGTDLRTLTKTAPKHLGFLEAIAECHHSLCNDIMKIIHKAYMRDYPGLDVKQVDLLHEMFLKSVSSMVKSSDAAMVVSLFQKLWVDGECIKNMDLRRFLGFMFKTMSPPYSSAFAVAASGLLADKRVIAAIEGDAALAGKVFTFQDETGALLSKAAQLEIN